LRHATRQMVQLCNQVSCRLALDIRSSATQLGAAAASLESAVEDQFDSVAGSVSAPRHNRVPNSPRDNPVYHDEPLFDGTHYICGDRQVCPGSVNIVCNDSFTSLNRDVRPTGLPAVTICGSFAPRSADAARKQSSRIAGTKLLPRRPVLCAKCRPHVANLTRRAEWF
jgi:hypothetical protein